MLNPKIPKGWALVLNSKRIKLSLFTILGKGWVLNYLVFGVKLILHMVVKEDYYKVLKFIN